MTRTNSPAPIIILAEDRRQARFIRAYLRHRLPAVHQRDIFDAPMASGHGSGAKWVLDHYEAQVRAHLIRRAKRSSSTSPEKWLIVVIDADAGTVKNRLNELRLRIAESEDDRVRGCKIETANVSRLIPKWSIETWILNLNGEIVDEGTKYKSLNRDWDRLIQPAGIELHRWVNTKDTAPTHCTSSLKDAIGELRGLTS